MKLSSVEAIVGALEKAGVRYLVAGGLAIPTLIAMKEAAGRPQDIIDIDQLRMRLKGDGQT